MNYRYSTFFLLVLSNFLFKSLFGIPNYIQSVDISINDEIRPILNQNIIASMKYKIYIWILLKCWKNWYIILGLIVFVLFYQKIPNIINIICIKLHLFFFFKSSYRVIIEYIVHVPTQQNNLKIGRYNNIKKILKSYRSRWYTQMSPILNCLSIVYNVHLNKRYYYNITYVKSLGCL